MNSSRKASCLEGQYLAHDGETRAFVLVDLLAQPQKLRVA
jgi:hypothetical protein